MAVQERLEQWLADQTQQPHPIHEYAFITTEQLTFSEKVREACKANYCGRYGKSWTCPPGAGPWEDLRDHFKSYPHALVFTTKHDLEDSFDVEGMDEGRKLHDLVDEYVVKMLADEMERHELAGAGSCSICSKCTYPDAPCRFPEKARRSMEACGIDVVQLSRDTNIHYINGANTVTYFSIVFF